MEIDKDVDESKEDAGNETNNDNSLLGNSDKYDCNQITGYENYQWIAKHILEEIPSSNARFQLWEFLICSNQHSVLPGSMTTNGTSRGDKKAPPWQPRLLQVFQTGSLNARDPNTGKTKYQAVITSKVHPQMANVRGLTWKFEMPVNDLRPVLSLIDKQGRKQKDQCHISNIAPPAKFSVESRTKSTSKNKINRSKLQRIKLQQQFHHSHVAMPSNTAAAANSRGISESQQQQQDVAMLSNAAITGRRVQ